MKVNISMNTKTNEDLGYVITWVIGLLVKFQGYEAVNNDLLSNIAKNFISIKKIEE